MKIHTENTRNGQKYTQTKNPYSIPLNLIQRQWAKIEQECCGLMGWLGGWRGLTLNLTA